MSAQFDNFNSDLNTYRYYLEDEKSGLIISKISNAIVVIDKTGAEVCRTYNLNENGLKWCKTISRGWNGWTRRNWIVKKELIKSIII